MNEGISGIERKKIALVAHDNKKCDLIAVVWNIPIACNRASADFIFSSPLMVEEYQRVLPDYETYRQRDVTSGADR